MTGSEPPEGRLTGCPPAATSIRAIQDITRATDHRILLADQLSQPAVATSWPASLDRRPASDRQLTEASSMRIRWRGLELPNRVTCDRETLTDTYGKFVAEPFERGFGVTVGNSLRRILLSSLEGSAVTQIKIQGVQHEITTIPGVVEDVTDIILNIKSLVVKNPSDQPKTIRIDRHEKGVVTAADIITDESVEIINPEHIIATLTDDVPFVVEMASRTAAATARPRKTPQGTRDRHHSGRFQLLARWSASSTRSRKPASVRRPTTTS